VRKCGFDDDSELPGSLFEIFPSHTLQLKPDDQYGDGRKP
jgi:hypothetical protein